MFLQSRSMPVKRGVPNYFTAVAGKSGYESIGRRSNNVMKHSYSR